MVLESNCLNSNLALPFTIYAILRNFLNHIVLLFPYLYNGDPDSNHSVKLKCEY